MERVAPAGLDTRETTAQQRTVCWTFSLFTSQSSEEMRETDGVVLSDVHPKNVVPDNDTNVTNVQMTLHDNTKRRLDSLDFTG